MSVKPVLKIDWCSHAAARYGCQRWHYSRSLPLPPLVKIGVWESDRFIGCILFSRGANSNLHHTYRLALTEICELTRIALDLHITPVSRIVRIAVKQLQRANPGLRLVVSYADPNYGHHGGIYQACGWIYTGQTASDFAAIDRLGRRWHSRQIKPSGVVYQYGRLVRVPTPRECRLVPLRGKYRYLYPLDAAMRVQILPLAQPYPKRVTSSDSAAPAHPAGEGGASPTVALLGGD